LKKSYQKKYVVKTTDFRENFRYFHQFSLGNFRGNENKFLRKCKNENFRFNHSKDFKMGGRGGNKEYDIVP
jgi:hypothetical protein